MRHCIESLRKVEDGNINLFVAFSLAYQVVGCHQELCLTRVAGSKPVVGGGENPMIVKVASDMCANDVFHQFAGYASQGHWPVISRVGSIPLFEDWCYPCCGPVFG